MFRKVWGIFWYWLDKSVLLLEYFYWWEFFKVGIINRKVSIIKVLVVGLEFIVYRFLVNVFIYSMVFCNKIWGGEEG